MTVLLITLGVIYALGVVGSAFTGVLMRVGTTPLDEDRYQGARLIFLAPLWPALAARQARIAWHDFKAQTQEVAR